jgi:Flp pilus assembly protein TadG
MLNNTLNKIKSFKRHDKGGVLIFVAMSILPLFLMLGLAVDGSYGLLQKRKLQVAVDAAAKAGAAYSNNSSGQAQTNANTMFSALSTGMNGTISGPNVTYNPNTNCVTVSASITVPTYFMQLGGITSASYSASSSACQSGNRTELAVVFDLSNTNGNWTSKMISSLQGFVTNMPAGTLVSIVPATTVLQLDPTTTVQGNLYSHLSNTTNDENANPALYALGSNYAWNSTNYGSVYNYLYGMNYPSSNSYYPLPGTCTGWGGPGTYLACSILYPGTCSVGHPSCNQKYTYTSYGIPAILPLTANKNTLSNFLTSLGSYSESNADIWPALAVWGWRTLDPQWRDFWQVNSDATNNTRTTGIYPSAYPNPKNVMLVMTGGTTWGSSNLANSYNSLCGVGSTKWQMTYYGILPLTSDRSAFLDITCDNYNYKTVDQSLGLGLSATNYYSSGQTSASYGTAVVTELNNKLLRICNNMKAAGINVYVITQYDDATLSQCASQNVSPYYQVTGNGVPSINVASVNVANNIQGPSTVQGGP